MRLDLATWPEIASYLSSRDVIVLPVGSTEQHGPIGLIGTDAICATAVAERAAVHGEVIVAPTLSYTPASFNEAFPGTISVSVPLFRALFDEVVKGLHRQGFVKVFVLNAHGANLAPMREVAANKSTGLVRIRSWWDFPSVNELRQHWYGEWEGLHATPSEISITQAIHRVVTCEDAVRPPRKLSPKETAERAGDRHEGPEEHRAEFPDGRVGSHSALARPEHGSKLLETAARAVAEDILEFERSDRS